MKVKDSKELQHKTVEELRKILLEKQNDLVTARLDHVRGKLKNSSSLKGMRKYIAQILTAMRGKELAQHGKNA